MNQGRIRLRSWTAARTPRACSSTTARGSDSGCCASPGSVGASTPEVDCETMPSAVSSTCWGNTARSSKTARRPRCGPSRPVLREMPQTERNSCRGRAMRSAPTSSCWMATPRPRMDLQGPPPAWPKLPAAAHRPIPARPQPQLRRPGPRRWCSTSAGDRRSSPTARHRLAADRMRQSPSTWVRCGGRRGSWHRILPGPRN